MLPVETLKLIGEMATRAMPQVVDAPACEPPGVYYVRQPDGSLTRTDAGLPPDMHTAADLDTLVRVARFEVENYSPEIWYSRAGVVGLLQPGEHPDRCTLPLSPSPQLARLMEWDRAGRVGIAQAELVLMLRTLFAGCVPDSLVEVVRNVRTSKAADVNSQIQQGKVSLGKTMVAEMTGTGGIPPRVTFSVPVFAQAAVPVTGAVRVEIDPDPQNERFTLVVLPGDIEAAQAQAETAIASRLAAALGEFTPDGPSPVPIYRGQP